MTISPAGGRFFSAYCTVCNDRTTGNARTVQIFETQHAAHQSTASGFGGLGDAVAAVAKPVARAFGKQPCAPCEARRRKLNELAPRFYRK